MTNRARMKIKKIGRRTLATISILASVIAVFSFLTSIASLEGILQIFSKENEPKEVTDELFHKGATARQSDGGMQVESKEPIRQAGAPKTAEQQEIRSDSTQEATPLKGEAAKQYLVLPTKDLLLSAVAIAGDSGDLEGYLSQSLIDHMAGISTILRRNFFDDGLFLEAFAGDPSSLIRLNFGKYTSLIILGRNSSESAPNDSIEEGLWTGTSTITTRVYVASQDFKSRVFRVNRVAPSFSQDVAKRRAEDAAISDLAEKISIFYEEISIDGNKEAKP